MQNILGFFGFHIEKTAKTINYPIVERKKKVYSNKGKNLKSFETLIKMIIIMEIKILGYNNMYMNFFNKLKIDKY